MSSSSDLNVWTVLWQSPDGKPFLYRTSPLGSAKEVQPRRFEVAEAQQYQRMVLKHLPDAKFRCLTNVDIPGVEVVPLETDLVAWWAKMELWRPGLPEGRNVYFDLDTLLIRGIKGIANFPATFAVAPGMSGMERRGGGRWEDNEHKWRYPGYQTSCMVWDTSEAKSVWDKFQSDKDGYLDHLASDQDFLGKEFPGITTMPREWFTKLRTTNHALRRDVRVVLTMTAHNDGAAKQYQWARQAWNG